MAEVSSGGHGVLGRLFDYIIPFQNNCNTPYGAFVRCRTMLHKYRVIIHDDSTEVVGLWRDRKDLSSPSQEGLNTLCNS